MDGFSCYLHFLARGYSSSQVIRNSNMIRMSISVIEYTDIIVDGLRVYFVGFTEFAAGWIPTVPLNSWGGLFLDAPASLNLAAKNVI
jgi:hypothetical protein